MNRSATTGILDECQTSCNPVRRRARPVRARPAAALKSSSSVESRRPAKRGGLSTVACNTRPSRAGRSSMEGRAQVNGVELWYQLTGEGEPVVQIHGAGFGHFNFAPATPVLSERF